MQAAMQLHDLCFHNLTPQAQKPIIRKGFFDKPNALDDEERELYPDGSSEGIMAPGQGDAINFIDPKLKDTCHIIDPSQMSQDAMQAVSLQCMSRNARMSTGCRVGLARLGCPCCRARATVRRLTAFGVCKWL